MMTNNSKIKKVARAIFKEVEADLLDRRGIRQGLDNIDKETQKEIIKNNEARILLIRESM